MEVNRVLNNIELHCMDTKKTQTFFRISSFVFHSRKKVIQVLNDTKVSK